MWSVEEGAGLQAPMRLGKTQRTRHSMRDEASDRIQHALIKGAGAIVQNYGKTLVREGVGKTKGHCHDGGQGAKSRACKVERTGPQKKRGELSSPGTCPLLKVSTLNKTCPSRSCAGPGPPP